MNNLRKNEKGITLIALVVTIVVLLILAGVSISMLTGENGIIAQANNAKIETRGGNVEERVSNWKSENKLNEYSPIEVKSERDFIQELKDQKLVYDNEIDEENKIIKIGSREIYYGIGENDITVLKFLVNSGEDGIVVLPIAKENCNETGYQVDWGDGTTGIDDTVIANNDTKLASRELYLAKASFEGIPHTYKETNKDYEVTIRGKCEYIGVDCENTTKEKIIEVLQWGETGLKFIYLEGCSNLRKIASPTFNSFNNVTNWNWAFSNCKSLASIPENLFENCPNVTNFSWAFYNCICLESIPSGLFKNCSNVTSFNGAFRDCARITTIPVDLFANCTSVTDFGYTFTGCTSLGSIPENLFENCPNVTNFAYSFWNCTGLTGNASELWTRVADVATNGYKGTPNGEGCFANCSNLTNYKQIPEYWKTENTVN